MDDAECGATETRDIGAVTDRHVTIHDHFYQPPRENPWLEAIERQESAHPHHDWNERILAECYAPNAWPRVLDPEGRIVRRGRARLALGRARVESGITRETADRDRAARGDEEARAWMDRFRALGERLLVAIEGRVGVPAP